MSIAGIGVDAVRPSRVQQSLVRFGDRFARRILTDREFAAFELIAHNRQSNYLAKRFAAKEAAAKALGTGIRGIVNFHAFEINYTVLGQPVINMSAAFMTALENGQHKKTVSRSNLNRINISAQSSFHLSFTDDADLVIAFVVIDG